MSTAGRMRGRVRALGAVLWGWAHRRLTLCVSHQSTLGRPVRPAQFITCVGLYCAGRRGGKGPRGGLVRGRGRREVSGVSWDRRGRAGTKLCPRAQTKATCC